VQPLHSCRPVKTTRAESFPGLIPASQPRSWTFPRWTVRMVVFVRGSTHRIDLASERAEALFSAPHALGDNVPGRRRPPLRNDNRRAFQASLMGKRSFASVGLIGACVSARRLRFST
jgi:hypothetical protein